jgi:hypothetical protein
VQVLYDLRDPKLTEQKIGYAFIVTARTHKTYRHSAPNVLLQKDRSSKYRVPNLHPRGILYPAQGFLPEDIRRARHAVRKGLVADLEPFFKNGLGRDRQKDQVDARKCQKNGVYFLCYLKTIDPEN